MKANRFPAIAACLLCVLPAAAGSLKVDKAKSRIQVDAKATGHAFTGTLSDYDIDVDGDESSLTPSAVKLDWEFSKLKTGEKKRDQEMIKWLGGGGPVGSFKFDKSWDAKGTKYAQGTLSIHGVSKTISFPYTATKDGDWVTIDGTATMNYEDFKLPVISTMLVMKVDPQLAIRFHLVGRVN